MSIGNMLSKVRSCRCSDIDIKRYKNRLSDPFLDRIDIFVTMQEINRDDKSDISSEDMRDMVLIAFERQKRRGQKRLNGKLRESEVDIYCKMNEEAQDTLFFAIDRFGLSNRALDSIKKVARTIADLDGAILIKKSHIVEAISYSHKVKNIKKTFFT